VLSMPLTCLAVLTVAIPGFVPSPTFSPPGKTCESDASPGRLAAK
jgi:hypothetical protein